MSKNYYSSGQWNVTCDVCSKKIKSGEAKMRWDGFIVCPDDFEVRQPQDFVKARQDKISVPFSRPIPTLTYVPLNFTERVVDFAWPQDSRLIINIGSIVSDSSITSDSFVVSVGQITSDIVSTSDSVASLIYTSVEVSDSSTTADAVTFSYVSSTALNGDVINGDVL